MRRRGRPARRAEPPDRRRAFDFCGSGAVDLVLAKGALAAHCAEIGRRHVAFGEFCDLTAELPAIVALLAAEAPRRTVAA